MLNVLVDGLPVDYTGLPETHRETARLYFEDGYEPGSGWTAILCSDLRAVVTVDRETLDALPEIYRWLVNHAPSGAWGSTAKVLAWIADARRVRRVRHMSELLEVRP